MCLSTLPILLFVENLVFRFCMTMYVMLLCLRRLGYMCLNLLRVGGRKEPRCLGWPTAMAVTFVLILTLRHAHVVTVSSFSGGLRISASYVVDRHGPRISI